MITNPARRHALEYELLLGIATLCALMLYAVARYPASLSTGGLTPLLTTTAALLAYGGAAIWARRQTSPSMRTALAHGVKIGIPLGIAAIVSHTLEVFGHLDATLSTVFGVGMWGLMFLAFGGAGSATYQRTGSLPLAPFASMWGALISTVMILIYGYGLALLFMSQMQTMLQGPFAQSGLTDPQAYVIRNTLESGTSHVVLAPIVAGIFGLAGACAAVLLGRIGHNLALALSVGALLLFGAGLAALRLASSLERGARPPYILFGLLALGLTLASAHPLVTAFQRRTTAE